MSELLDQLGQQMVTLLKAQAEELGAAVEADGQELALFSSELAQELSDAVDEPGWNQLVVTQARRLSLKAAVRATERADDVDARVAAVARGALGIAATALGSLGPPTA